MAVWPKPVHANLFKDRGVPELGCLMKWRGELGLMHNTLHVQASGRGSNAGS